MTGTWTPTATCGIAASFSSSLCQSQPISSSVSYGGVLTFNADLTYAVAFKESGSITVGIPTSCLTSNSLTCDDFNRMFAANVAANPAIQSIDCVASDIGCTCTEVLLDLGVDQTGTYSTSGTTLSLSGGTPTEYCVRGNQLHIMTVGTTTNMGSMGQVAISSDVVLTK